MTIRPRRVALLPARLALLSVGLALVTLPSPSARAQATDPNACDAPGDAPDVIVGDLFETNRWGHVGNITAFSVGTYSCNIGTCWLNWITGADSNQHPTIGQNMFRLKNGRFEHIGQSWLKHGFYALSDNLCRTGCLATDGEHLGVNCADPYSAGLNGTQRRLGPKFEINASMGFHPHPVTDLAIEGDAVFKRLQVHDADLDPALNAGATYFIEGQYICQDDAAAGNHHNNASFRPITVNGGGSNFDIQLQGVTQRMRPAILAWSDADPTVQIAIVDDTSAGRFYEGAKATDLGGGMWHYEYAVQNLDSDRSGGSYSVPIPTGATVTNIGFHDVDYHSGEPQDGTDWSNNGGAQNTVTWNVVSATARQYANALRWGTLYNFRFDCDRPPGTSLVTIGLFKRGLPGSENSLVAALIAPFACNNNGTCDAGESCVSCPTECSNPGPDNDGDGIGYCADCNDNTPHTWATPGETINLHARRGPAGEVMLNWAVPTFPGANPAQYELLRSTVARDFATAPLCLRSADPTLRTLTDAGAPTAGPRLYYLVRARSTCAMGVGSTGTDSFGRGRSTAVCP